MLEDKKACTTSSYLFNLIFWDDVAKDNGVAAVPTGPAPSPISNADGIPSGVRDVEEACR
jgi:hypothetical protein